MAIGVISAGLAIGSSLLGAREKRKARKAQRRGIRAQQRLQAMQAMRARRDAVREARIAQAEFETQKYASGAGNSSLLAGGQSSIQTQTTSNLAYFDRAERLTGEMTRANIQVARAQGRGAAYEAIGQLGLFSFQEQERIGSLINDGFF